MNILEELLYTKTHEWAKRTEDTVRVGITDYAQHEITEVVHVELPEVGTVVKQGEAAAVVESVKAVFDIYAPVSGKVRRINEALEEQPELVNESPYDQGYFFEIAMEDETELQNLLDAAAYQKEISED